jgi:hypothetical protein
VEVADRDGLVTSHEAEEKAMPKTSKSTASHVVIPGYTEMYEQEVGGWTVTVETILSDIDYTPFFKGGPNDQCPASHVGYVLKGKFGVRRPDGVEEIFEAGDAFVIEPGHIPMAFAGTEYLAFTPTAEAKEQMAIIMPNMIKVAKEQGIELPAELMPS